MNHSRSISSFLILVLLMFGCQQKPEPLKEVKDLKDFKLPERVKEEAPHMQAHLYKMVAYNSDRFPVKPEFVFLDLEKLQQGRPNPAVRRFNFLHVAYFKKGQHIWSGSAMVSRKRGQMFSSRKGYLLGVKSEEGEVRIDFRDGDLRIDDHFSYTEDHEKKHSLGDVSLYVNFYTFPDEMIRPRLSPIKPTVVNKKPTSETPQK